MVQKEISLTPEDVNRISLGESISISLIGGEELIIKGCMCDDCVERW